MTDQADIVERPRFKERWTHTITQKALRDFVGIGGRPTIGLFDSWAKRRAAELGLRLVATDDFEWSHEYASDSIHIAATVLLEDAGDPPVIEGECEEITNMGLVPYIRQIEHKSE